jgi:uncharacterized protein (UPF0248 family)
MPNPRIILNELKWKNGFDINLAEIWYIHRGAPNDTKIITGRDILDLEKSFMKTTSSMIPYHRIIKIVYKDEIIFKRRKK